MMCSWQRLFEVVFSATLFIKAAMFVPQIWRLYQLKDAKSLSLVTFLTMNIMQLLMVVHAFLRRDLVLMGGVALSLITSGAVTVLIIYYRWIRR